MKNIDSIEIDNCNFETEKHTKLGKLNTKSVQFRVEIFSAMNTKHWTELYNNLIWRFYPTTKIEKNKSNSRFKVIQKKKKKLDLLRFCVSPLPRNRHFAAVYNDGRSVISISAARPDHCSSWYRITCPCPRLRVSCLRIRTVRKRLKGNSVRTHSQNYNNIYRSHRRPSVSRETKP